VTDPPTWPVKYRDQIVCALIGASVSYAGFELAGAVSYLLIVMLAGNVWEARRRARAHLRKQHERAVVRAGHAWTCGKLASRCRSQRGRRPHDYTLRAVVEELCRLSAHTIKKQRRQKECVHELPRSSAVVCC
jgi:hypothetical protein